MTEEQLSIMGAIEKARQDLPKGRMTSNEYVDWMLFLGALTDVVTKCSDNHALVTKLQSLEYDIKFRGIGSLTSQTKYGITYMGLKGDNVEGTENS